MPKIITPHEYSFSSSQFNAPPFGLLTVLPNLFREIDSKHLIFDIRTLPAGEYSFPYHYHRNAEEIMFVIEGEMTARTGKGFESLKKGDLFFCETGETGAHQFFNHSSENCTYLDVKTFFGMDVVVYPDSDKIMISQYNEAFRKDSVVDYFEGEGKVAERWKELGYKS